MIETQNNNKIQSYTDVDELEKMREDEQIKILSDLMEKKKYEEIIFISSKLINRGHKAVFLLEKRALAYDNIQKYELAINDIDALLTINPENVSYISDKAWYSWKIGNEETAFKLLDYARTISEDNRELLTSYAYIYAEKGDYNQAFPWLELLMRKKLGKVLDIKNYFSILIGVKAEYERAVRELDKVIADKPDVAHFHYQKGAALFMMCCKNSSLKYKKEFCDEIKKAVDMEPENTVYRYALGLLDGKLKGNVSLSL